ncbi:hypothetical protein [Streptomyces sp. NPDC048282]|uniref:hypothetical protein n=1 Tax=Streptomyces sp. NPDC048282 TaxID=3365528 RepID=UPI003717DC1B
MPRGTLVVTSGPVSEEAEPAYDEWYDTPHVPQVPAPPGPVSARRPRLAGTSVFGPPAQDGGTRRYLTLYEIEAADVAHAAETSAAALPGMTMTQVMAPGRTTVPPAEEIPRT